MGDPEILKWFATLGVGGALAAGMFLYYRKDALDWTKQWQEHAAHLEQQTALLIQVVKENASAISANTEIIRSLQIQLSQRKDKE